MIPYKLFELVPGAVLTARAAPGTEMRVRLPLVTPLGRRFRYLASARADDAGRIELRVPYPTDPSAPVRSQGPYRIQLGAVRLRLEVSEAETRDGSTVRVPDGSSELW